MRKTKNNPIKVTSKGMKNLKFTPGKTRIPGIRSVGTGAYSWISPKALLIGAIAGSASIISAYLTKVKIINNFSGKLITTIGIAIAFLFVFWEGVRRFRLGSKNKSKKIE